MRHRVPNEARRLDLGVDADVLFFESDQVLVCASLLVHAAGSRELARRRRVRRELARRRRRPAASRPLRRELARRRLRPAASRRLRRELARRRLRLTAEPSDSSQVLRPLDRERGGEDGIALERATGHVRADQPPERERQEARDREIVALDVVDARRVEARNEVHHRVVAEGCRVDQRLGVLAEAAADQDGARRFEIVHLPHQPRQDVVAVVFERRESHHLHARRASADVRDALQEKGVHHQEPPVHVGAVFAVARLHEV